MSVDLYGLKNCDSCRKAVKQLEADGHAVQFHDLRAEPVSSTTLEEWLKAAGKDKLLNTRSTTWRSLDEGEKEIADDQALIALLEKHPTLIKRPIVRIDDTVHVGWKK